MLKKWVGIVLATWLASWGAVSVADDDAAALDRFKEAGAAEMIGTAYGYAVFPTIGKGGVGIGGAYGEGRVYRKGGALAGNTSMAQVTWGLQLGGQAYSQLILFEDERAFEEFTSGNFEFSAQATAVALTAGAGAEANTTGAGTNVSGGQNDAAIASAGYRKGMAIFTIAKGGLMYEASIGGQKFSYTPK